MPDPVMQLVEQHNRMRRLFKQMPGIGGHQQGAERGTAIALLYRVHSKIEEEIIYPVLRRLDDAMADKAFSDHATCDELVDRIAKQDYANNGEVKADLKTLEVEFERHSRWEEETLLPKLGELHPDELDQLGSRVYERNQQLLKEFPGALETSAETEGFLAAPRI